MAIRFTSANKDALLSQSQSELMKFTIDEISPAILTGLSQFKNLCKQFSEFHQKIAQNADTTFISDRTLQHLQLLNDASLDLSCVLSVTQIFDVINRTILNLLSNPQYDKCSVIMFKNGLARKMYDNTRPSQQNKTAAEDHAAARKGNRDISNERRG